MVKYLGSKRRLLNVIEQAVRDFRPVVKVTDAFSGTARVGNRLKGAGYQVLANDHNLYATTMARCYVEAGPELEEPALAILRELNGLPGEDGFFTRTYCEQARFFQAKNGRRIDAIRRRVREMEIAEPLRSVVFTSLLEAADRVDSTTGLQMAYLKQWSARSYDELELRMPALVPGVGRVTESDAINAVREPADLIYLDPPYNQHSYLANYHIWETLVTGDEPEVYGIAQKRLDVRTRKSAFNFKREFGQAFTALVEACAAPNLLISFSNEGFLPYEELASLLLARGEVAVRAHPYRRYVGAQIGIYNPTGDKVGRVSHLKNVEFLFACAPRLPEAWAKDRILRADAAPASLASLSG